MKWQGDPVAGPAKIPGGRLLWRFKIGGPSDRDLARQAANEALTHYQVVEAIDDYQQATAEPLVQPMISMSTPSRPRTAKRSSITSFGNANVSFTPRVKCLASVCS